MNVLFIAVLETEMCSFWAEENPHFTMTLEHNPPHVMLWAGLTSNALLGPYFFTGSVNAETYSDMLEKWVVPQLRDRLVGKYLATA